MKSNSILYCILFLSTGYLFALYEINILYALLVLLIIGFRKIIFSMINKIRGHDLFDGDDRLFKQHILTVDIYGEYGVGESTIWTANNTQVSIISVDTSQAWIEKVKSNIKLSNRVDIDWVDLGELGRWGRPLSYNKKEFIYDYIKSIWLKTNKPELILIDGRFRVCCFLYSLVQGSPGTKIIFDDYVNRPHYHIIEEFIKPAKIYGRQGLFVIPENLDYKNIEQTIPQFIYVMD